MRRVRSSDDVVRARAELGMTQVEFAAALRIKGWNAAQTIQRWESGKNKGGVPGPVTVAIEALLTGFRPTNYQGSK